MNTMKLYLGLALISTGTLLLALPLSGIFLSVSALGGSGEILVTDAGGNPLAGASVTFTKVELYGNEYPVGLTIGETDVNGVREFSISNIGKFTYEVEKSDYEKTVGTIDIALGQHSYSQVTLIKSVSSVVPPTEAPEGPVEVVGGAQTRGVIMAVSGIATMAVGAVMVVTSRNQRWRMG